MTEMMKAFEDAAAKMSPDEVPVADLDPDLHKRAAQLAQKRAQLFVRDFGKLVARNRDALETSSASMRHVTRSAKTS